MSLQRNRKAKKYSLCSREKSRLEKSSCRKINQLKDANQKLRSQILRQRIILKKLHDDVSRFWKYLNFSNAIILALDKSGRVSFINDQGVKLLGRRKKDILGKRWFRYFIPSRIRPVTEKVFHLLMKGKIKPASEYFENPIVDGKGRERIIRWHNKILKNEKGKIEGTLSSGEDVSEKKETESALRDNEEKFRSVAEQSPNMIFIRQGERIIYANKKCEDVMGYQVEEFYGPRFSFLHLIHPEDAPLIRRHLGFSQKNKGISSREYRLLTKNKKTLHVIVTSKPICLKNGWAIMGIVTDITERQWAENEQKQSLSLLKATLESTADGILVVNRFGRITGFNEPFMKMWKIPKSILAAHDDQKALAFVLKQLKDPKKFLSKVNWLYNHPTEDSFDSIEFKDGRIFERYSRPQRIEGYAVGRVWSFRDVTLRKNMEIDLTSSAVRFRRLFETAQDGILILDSKTAKITEVNRFLMDMLGYARNEFLGKTLPQLGLFENVQTYRKIFRILEKKGYVRYDNLSIRSKKGETILVEFVSNAYWVGKEKVIQCNIRDIADRVKSEEEIKKMASVVEHSDELVNLATLDGKMVFINKAGGKMLGLNPKEISHVNIRQVLPKHIRKKVEKEILPMLKKGSSWKGELQYLNLKTRKTTDVQAMTFAIRDPNTKKVRYLANVSLDITTHKKAELAIDEGRRQLRQIIDTVPHMIFAKDKRGRFLLVNRAVGDMYGMDSRDLIGKRRQDVHRVAEESRSYLAVDQEVLNSGKPKMIPAEKFTDSRGDVHILQTIKIPFKMQGIDEPVILSVSVDITEQKKIEEFRNDVVRTVSHELRTPLSIEKEGVNLLLDGSAGELNENQKMLLRAIMKNIDRLARIIDSLLDISHIESRKLKLTKSVVDIRDIVREVVFEFRTKNREKKVHLIIDLPREAVWIFADPDKVVQVLSNLMDNAVKFTKDGTIRVSLRVLQNEVECSVQDTGTGIAPEHIHQIFEKFHQFGRIVGPGEKGLGLGLSITKGLVEMHQGRIWAKSKLGVGTQMTFSLPLYKEKGF